MSIKKILGITGIRSDYDLMYYLYRKLARDPELDFRLLVSGAHMSSTYGNTVQQIEADDFRILAKIESLIDGNTRSARLTSAALSLLTSIHNVEAFAPDLILYHGDREEVLIGGLLGVYLRIPSIHFFGGDHACDGNIDNPVRQAASKLSTFHFVRELEHRERLLKSGESAERIFYVGDPSDDKFAQEDWIDCPGLLSRFSLAADWQKYAVVIHHPIAGEENRAGEYFEQILTGLIKKKMKAFVSYPNIDAGNKDSIEVIQRYKDHPQFVFYKNLDRNLFVNLLRHAQFLIGNSSAGLFEAPCIGLPVINVGKRQLGRKLAQGVRFIEQNSDAIDEALSLITIAARERQLDVSGKKMSFAEECYRLIKTLHFQGSLAKVEDPLKPLNA